MKAAIVTGASSGIGMEISKVLINNNYKIYGLGRDFSSCFIESDLFVPITFNLLKTSELCNQIKEIQQKDEVSLLVNNAGVGYFGPHEELNPQKIHEMVTVNLEVPLILTQLLLRDLKKYAGYVINISSVTAGKSNTHGCAYGATKAGLSSFSRSLFDEVRKHGVKVITIQPDMTKSKFYRNAGFMEGDADDTYLLPEDIGAAVDQILKQRDGILLSEITILPQRHKIKKKM